MNVRNGQKSLLEWHGVQESAVFVEVVRQGSFTEAARVLFSTQSTVSKMVKQLEEVLGAPLLDRSGRRVIATAAGEIVYRRALGLLGAREDLLSELQELQGLKRGTLRLGIPTVGGEALFAPILSRFRQCYPGIEVQLMEHGSAHLQEALRSGEVDLAGLLQPIPDEFDAAEMRREPIVAVLPVGHPLAQVGSVTLGALADVPAILFDHGFVMHATMIEAYRKEGIKVQIAAQSSQVTFMLALVESGMGVTYLPKLIAQNYATSATQILSLTKPALEWRMTMAWRRNGYRSAAAQAWLDLATNVARGMSVL
ncbi:LysR family transcriptional regulator [Hankyongella ginsenosidimutans]|uniref:LysR family transcriptional regulator n=2 Tax=Hankyongella ginsenosidimutans TaxID=1763828 RepID=A0A4D7C242_9SPHN|nr:LysR family transcriptional regulator [Hankyongella ginsenosidimutans]